MEMVQEGIVFHWVGEQVKGLRDAFVKAWYLKVLRAIL